MVLDEALQELESRQSWSFGSQHRIHKPLQQALLLLNTPVPHHVPVLLGAAADELQILGRWIEDDVPEELGDSLLEVRAGLLRVLTELAEAVELLHVQLVPRSVLTHLLENEIEVLLPETGRTGLNDLVRFGPQFCLGETPEVPQQLRSESVFLKQQPQHLFAALNQLQMRLLGIEQDFEDSLFEHPVDQVLA